MRWQLGDSASQTMIVDDAYVQRCADAIDLDPGQLEDEQIMQTIFGGRAVHGPVSAVLISAILGTQLPGPGSVLLKQTFNYLAPVFVGDMITARVEITHLREDRPVITLAAKIINQHDVPVIDGEATVLFRDLDEWRRLNKPAEAMG